MPPGHLVGEVFWRIQHEENPRHDLGHAGEIKLLGCLEMTRCAVRTAGEAGEGGCSKGGVAISA